MHNFFGGAKKLSRWQYREIAAFCGGVALLLLVAGFISGGGMAKVNHLLAIAHITHESQTANIFPCGWFGYCSSAPVSVVSGLTVSNTAPTPGSSVTAYPTESGGPYGTTLCNEYVWGGEYGAGPNQWGTGGDMLYTCIGGDNDGAVDYLQNENGSACDSSIPAYTSGTYYATYDVPVSDFPAPPPAWNTPPLTQAGTTYTVQNVCYSALVNSAATVYVTPVAPVIVPVTPVAPTVTIDAGAGNGVTRTVTVGTSVTISGTFTSGSGDTITSTSLIDYQLNALPGISAAVPPTSKSYIFTPTAAGSYIFYPSVTTVTYPGWNNYGKSVTVTVNPAAIPDACTDIPGTQSTPPSGCVGPIPSTPGTCIPTGGSYSSGTNTCSCPAGTTLIGTACIASAPLCANGLANSYAPGCTCPAGQIQSGSLCVIAPVPSCANGLANSYAPSCTCPAGQVQSGTTCVLQGVIQSFTASPSRVLKGNTATVSWSTSGMTSCSLTSLVSTGTAVLSSLLSTSITPIINSKTVFTLTCSDASGASYSASATVNLIPQTIEK